VAWRPVEREFPGWGLMLLPSVAGPPCACSQTDGLPDGSRMRPGQPAVGDHAAPDAEQKPAEHEPKARTGSVGLSHTTPPSGKGQEQCGKEQKFEETEDGKSQAEEEQDTLPKACKSGERDPQRNEDREHK